MDTLLVVEESDDCTRDGCCGDEHGTEHRGADVMDHHATASATNNRSYVLLLSIHVQQLIGLCERDTISSLCFLYRTSNRHRTLSYNYFKPFIGQRHRVCQLLKGCP